MQGCAGGHTLYRDMLVDTPYTGKCLGTHHVQGYASGHTLCRDTLVDLSGNTNITQGNRYLEVVNPRSQTTGSYCEWHQETMHGDNGIR